MTSGLVIYRDSLLRASVVVECDGVLFIVPHCRGGWHRRMRCHLTDEARQQRLTLARDIDPTWLGIDREATT